MKRGHKETELQKTGRELSWAVERLAAALMGAIAPALASIVASFGKAASALDALALYFELPPDTTYALDDVRLLGNLEDA